MSVCYGDNYVFELYISKNTLKFSVCFGDIWKRIFRNVTQNTLRDIIDQCVQCVECVMENFPAQNSFTSSGFLDLQHLSTTIPSFVPRLKWVYTCSLYTYPGKSCFLFRHESRLRRSWAFSLFSLKLQGKGFSFVLARVSTRLISWTDEVQGYFYCDSLMQLCFMSFIPLQFFPMYSCLLWPLILLWLVRFTRHLK